MLHSPASFRANKAQGAVAAAKVTVACTLQQIGVNVQVTVRCGNDGR